MLYINVHKIVQDEQENKAVFLINSTVLIIAKEFGWEILQAIQVSVDNLLIKLVKNMSCFLLRTNGQMALNNLMCLLMNLITQEKIDFPLVKLFIEKLSLVMEFQVLRSTFNALIENKSRVTQDDMERLEELQ